MSDWADPLLSARAHLKAAENWLALAGPLRNELGMEMLRKGELELTEAKVAINDALATLRD